MSGHSKWSQIKHKKAATDAKKSRSFSKILGAIAVAARLGNDPASNPRLRTLVEKAKSEAVPHETIERALHKSAESDALQEMTIEAYGPEKTAIIIEAITDNTNRTIAEVRAVLGTHGVKTADPGSVRWLFEHQNPGGPWIPKFTKTISTDGYRSLERILEALKAHPDVHHMTTDVIQKQPQ